MKKTKVNSTEEEIKNVIDLIVFREIGSKEWNIEQGCSNEEFNRLYNYLKDNIASIEKFLIEKDDTQKVIFCVIFIEESIMFKNKDEDEMVECIAYDCHFVLLENNELIYLDKESEIKL
jgi:hypothetical protein